MGVQVVRFDELPWESLGEHRVYHLKIKTLLRGREGATDNFRLTFSEGTGGTQTQPRHRHNFDQIRMPFNGRTSIAPKRWIEPGEIGYFPEGLHYGPQVDEMDVGKTQITLQFGGASGQGYLSSTQMTNATTALGEFGSFEKGLFHWRDGDPIRGRKLQDAFEAMWEHVNQRRIEYPVPRYRDQIVMRPASFPWLPDPDRTGVMVKSLGDFTERHCTVSMMRVEAGSAGLLGPCAGTLAAFVLNGSGAIDGKPVNQHSAASIDPGASARVESNDDLELVIFGMPVFGDTANVAQRFAELTARR